VEEKMHLSPSTLPIWAYDTEDDSKGKVKMLNFYNGLKHYTFKKPDESIEFLINEVRQATMWACNAEYDLNNLMGESDGLLCERTYLKTSFIKARIVNAPGVNIEFRDTLRHWKMGVAAMGEKLGFKKLPFDPDSVEYCQRDTEIVYRWVIRQQKEYEKLGAPLQATIGSSAVKLWKGRYDGNPGKISKGMKEQVSHALRGGRVEIFNTNLVHGRIDGYDINSMYPFVMKNNEYPDPSTAHRTDGEPDFNSEGVAEVTFDYPKNIGIPCLPVRRQTLLFPVGKFTGSFCYPEIRQALKDGAKILKVGRAIEFGGLCRPFDGYITDLYGRRVASKDDIQRDTLKLLMNNLYGKFGAKSSIEIVRGLTRSVKEMPSKDANMIWAAYVTSYARLHLLAALRKNEKHLLYCDTDSMYLLNAPVTKSGTALGEWKHEGTWGTAHFVLPKVYMLQREGQKFYKCKGVKKANAEQFFQGYEVEFDSPIRFRESFSRGIKPNVWVKKTRQLHHKYDKRIILKSGATRPIVLK
jgi:hypothetical protein